MTSAEQPVDPAEVGRRATWLLGAQLFCMLLFVAGGALGIWTFAKNGQSSLDCFPASVEPCGSHHSYVLPVTLLVTGFVGSLILIAVSGRLAIGYGARALAAYERRSRGRG